jgi:glycerophosphoryl diester phosphodiesterase
MKNLNPIISRMQRFAILCLVSLLLLVTGCDQAKISVTRAESIRQALENRDQSRVLVVSHRADWRDFPENSLPAIESAIEMGVDVLELDVQMTSDSVLILMHDSSVNRTTNGRGKVSEWTADSLAELRLRDGLGVVTNYRVPTLEEALALTKDRVMLNLDKADRYFNAVLALIEKTGTTRQIIMKGGASPEQVSSRFGSYLDKVIYMPIVNLNNPQSEEQIIKFVEELNPVAFELLFNDTENPLPKRIPEILNGRSLVWYNTMWDSMTGGHADDMSLNDPDAGYGYLIDSLGCRIMQTDRPRQLISYLRSRGLHD